MVLRGQGLCLAQLRGDENTEGPSWEGAWQLERGIGQLKVEQAEAEWTMDSANPQRYLNRY